MATGFTYSIVEIAREQVLSKIASYKYAVFCVNIATREVVDTSKITVDELVRMVNTTEWLYFYVKEKAE